MSAPSNDPVRVLLVEDDPVHRMIFERTAERLGGEVEVVGTASTRAGAEEAIAALERVPDVVLLDLTLPDSGLEETLGDLPGLARRWGARIVATSALGDASIPGRVRAAGGAAFLSKDGISAADLRAALRCEAPPERQAPAPAAPRPEAEGPPPRAIAAKLAHDVRSWIGAGKFRLMALRRAGSLEDALQHVDALAETYDAIAATVDAARDTVIDEMATLEVVRGDAVETAGEAVAAWRARIEDGAPQVEVTLEGATGPVHHDRTALARALDALLDNALQHAAPASGAVTVRIEGLPRALVVTDDGGAWDVAAPARLGEAASPGQRGAPHPGMGLYRARRLMERMGGNLTIEERRGAPGAHGVTLEFDAERT